MENCTWSIKNTITIYLKWHQRSFLAVNKSFLNPVFCRVVYLNLRRSCMHTGINDWKSLVRCKLLMLLCSTSLAQMRRTVCHQWLSCFAVVGIELNSSANCWDNPYDLDIIISVSTSFTVVLCLFSSYQWTLISAVDSRNFIAWNRSWLEWVKKWRRWQRESSACSPRHLTCRVQPPTQLLKWVQAWSVMLNEAKMSRPRPKLWGWSQGRGQNYGPRPRLRPSLRGGDQGRGRPHVDISE